MSISQALTARSLLFVPGHQPQRFAKALDSGADVVIIDLEDAVPPESKAAAADALRKSWTKLDRRRTIVRINAANTPWYDDDVDLCTELGVACIVVAKAENPDALLRLVERARRPERSIFALIESAHGLQNLRAIAHCSAVGRLLLGHIDLQADLGLSCGEDERELDSIRIELALSSRVAGLAAPVDGVTVVTRDVARVNADAQRSRRFGFGGKMCIHPMQVEPLHLAFTPSSDQVQWAQRVIKAMRLANGNAVTVDGRMVDRPVMLLAERVLQQSGRP